MTTPHGGVNVGASTSSAAENATQEDHLPRSASVVPRGTSQIKDIQSTETLISAFNEKKGDAERKALGVWLRGYFAWFKKQDAWELTQETMCEYAQLAAIRPRNASEKTLIEQHYRSLHYSLRDSKDLVLPVVQAMATVLDLIDEAVFDMNPTLLLNLTQEMLDRMGPDQSMSKYTYPTHSCTLAVIHKALVLINSIAPEELYVEEGRGLPYKMLREIISIRDRSTYFPFYYHLSIIERCFDQSQVDVSTVGRRISKNTRRFLLSFLFRPQGLWKASRARADMNIVEEGCIDAIKAFQRKEIDGGMWYVVVETLNKANLLQMTAPEKFELFDEIVGLALETQKTVSDDNQRRLIRYAIVDQLLTATVSSQRQQCRANAEKTLVELGATYIIEDRWGRSDPILRAYLDALRTAYRKSGHKEVIEEIFKMLSACDCEETKRILNDWLGNEALETKLGDEGDGLQTVAVESVYSQVRSDLNTIMTPERVAEYRQELVARYKHHTFSEVTPIFPGEIYGHVKDLSHDLIYYETVTKEKTKENVTKEETKKKDGDKRGGKEEEDEGDAAEPSSDQREDAKDKNEEDQIEYHYIRSERVKRPITVSELFSSKQPPNDEDHQLISKVLIHGDPGSGKTSISKQLAYNWAVGEWGSEFECVYHLEMRSIKDSEYDNVATRRYKCIETVIANICFSRRLDDGDYELLTTQIQHDLSKASTLLIMDGLDECSKTGKAIEKQAVESGSRILLLSRPYNLSYEKRVVDMEVECLGLSDSQLEDYVVSTVPDGTSETVIRLLKEDQTIWRMAHIPVTTQILCHLYQDILGKEEASEMKLDVFSLYKKMVELVWTRYVKKYQPKDDTLIKSLSALEKIAYTAFEEGQILIDECIVRELSASGATMDSLRDCGLLLLSLEGFHFQFPHLTFQEYFMGRYLCLGLLKSKGEQNTNARQWISKHKYSPKSRTVLVFMTQMLAMKNKDIGFHLCVLALDEQPIEILGIQHLILKLRALEAYVKCTNYNRTSSGEQSKTIRCIVDSTSKLIKALAHDISDSGIYMIEAIASLMNEMGTVLNEYNDIVDGVFSVLKTLSTDRWIKTKSAIETFMTIALNSASHKNDILELLRKGCRDTRWDVRQASIEVLKSIVDSSPSFASDAMELARKGCRDTRWDVRQASIEVLKSIVDSSPSFASDAIELAHKGCGDTYWPVRQASIEVLKSIVDSSPSFASDAMELARKGCRDTRWDVRQASIEVLKSIVDSSPSFASDAMELARKGCRDTRWDVRQASIEVLKSIVDSSPSIASDAIELARKGCGDTYWPVRQASIEVLKEIFFSCPSVMPMALFFLTKRLEDSYYFCSELFPLVKKLNVREVVECCHSSTTLKAGHLCFYFLITHSVCIEPPTTASKLEVYSSSDISDRSPCLVSIKDFKNILWSVRRAMRKYPSIILLLKDISPGSAVHLHL